MWLKCIRLSRTQPLSEVSTVNKTLSSKASCIFWNIFYFLGCGVDYQDIYCVCQSMSSDPHWTASATMSADISESDWFESSPRVSLVRVKNLRCFVNTSIIHLHNSSQSYYRSDSNWHGETHIRNYLKTRKYGVRSVLNMEWGWVF